MIAAFVHYLKAHIQHAFMEYRNCYSLILIKNTCQIIHRPYKKICVSGNMLLKIRVGR